MAYFIPEFYYHKKPEPERWSPRPRSGRLCMLMHSGTAWLVGFAATAAVVTLWTKSIAAVFESLEMTE